MNFILQPWQILFVTFCGFVNQRQTEIIDFQNAQITALLQKLGKKRILLTDDQRRLLAVKGKSIGRKALQELTTMVTPDTILRWHRELVAKKWDHTEKRKSVGRPRICQVIVDLILRFAKENPSWATTESKVPWPMSTTIFQTLPSVTFSEHTASNQLPNANKLDHGARFSKHIGACCQRLTSQRSKFGLEEDWSPSTCCS